MKRPGLRELIYWAVCCDLGLVAKRLINPAANLITDALHIPGGIATGFSLMFVAIAAETAPGIGCCAMISLVQSLLRLFTGHMGSMGALTPVGYVVPGLAMEAAFFLLRGARRRDRVTVANCVASVCAALTTNLIVFRLRGAALMLYLSVAALSGALFGMSGALVAERVIRAQMGHPIQRKSGKET